jgi:hypothetical protein
LAVGAQLLPEIAHDMRSYVSQLQTAEEIVRNSDLGSDEERKDLSARLRNNSIKRLNYYVNFLMDLTRHPGHRDIPLDMLPDLHERLNADLAVDWPIDAIALEDGAGRVIPGEYSSFLVVIAHALLLTIRRSSLPSIRVTYQFESDRLVGRADVADAAEVDPDGWHLVRLAAAVYGMPVAAEAAAGTLTVRWEFSLR